MSSLCDSFGGKVYYGLDLSYFPPPSNEAVSVGYINTGNRHAPLILRMCCFIPMLHARVDEASLSYRGHVVSPFISYLLTVGSRKIHVLDVLLNC